MRTARNLAAEADWTLLRAEVWLRDAGRCCLCRSEVSLQGAEIHHRLLRSRGGKDEHPNLVTLCSRCHHDRVHAFPVWATVVGFMVPSWSDPVAWPVLYNCHPVASPLWAVPQPVEGGWAWIVAAPHPDQHDERAPWVA